jgi:hypothetical protein
MQQLKKTVFAALAVLVGGCASNSDASGPADAQVKLELQESKSEAGVCVYLINNSRREISVDRNLRYGVEIGLEFRSIPDGEPPRIRILDHPFTRDVDAIGMAPGSVRELCIKYSELQYDYAFSSRCYTAVAVYALPDRSGQTTALRSLPKEICGIGGER